VAFPKGRKSGIDLLSDIRVHVCRMEWQDAHDWSEKPGLFVHGYIEGQNGGREEWLVIVAFKACLP
jgi:hypothetical protein